MRESIAAGPPEDTDHVVSQNRRDVGVPGTSGNEEVDRVAADVLASLTRIEANEKAARRRFRAFAEVVERMNRSLKIDGIRPSHKAKIC